MEEQASAHKSDSLITVGTLLRLAESIVNRRYPHETLGAYVKELRAEQSATDGQHLTVIATGATESRQPQPVFKVVKAVFIVEQESGDEILEVGNEKADAKLRGDETARFILGIFVEHFGDDLALSGLATGHYTA